MPVRLNTKSEKYSIFFLPFYCIIIFDKAVKYGGDAAIVVIQPFKADGDRSYFWMMGQNILGKPVDDFPVHVFQIRSVNTIICVVADQNISMCDTRVDHLEECLYKITFDEYDIFFVDLVWIEICSTFISM